MCVAFPAGHGALRRASASGRALQRQERRGLRAPLAARFRGAPGSHGRGNVRGSVRSRGIAPPLLLSEEQERFFGSSMSMGRWLMRQDL